MTATVHLLSVPFKVKKICVNRDFKIPNSSNLQSNNLTPSLLQKSHLHYFSVLVLIITESVKLLLSSWQQICRKMLNSALFVWYFGKYARKRCKTSYMNYKWVCIISGFCYPANNRYSYSTVFDIDQSLIFPYRLGFALFPSLAFCNRFVLPFNMCMKKLHRIAIWANRGNDFRAYGMTTILLRLSS